MSGRSKAVAQLSRLRNPIQPRNAFSYLQRSQSANFMGAVNQPGESKVDYLDNRHD
jgi:hypothetical protein